MTATALSDVPRLRRDVQLDEGSSDRHVRIAVLSGTSRKRTAQDIELGRRRTITHDVVGFIAQSAGLLGLQ